MLTSGSTELLNDRVTALCFKFHIGIEGTYNTTADLCHIGFIATLLLTIYFLVFVFHEPE